MCVDILFETQVLTHKFSFLVIYIVIITEMDTWKIVMVVQQITIKLIAMQSDTWIVVCKISGVH